MSVYKPNYKHFARQLTSINLQNYPNAVLYVRNDFPSDATIEPFVRKHLDNFPVVFMPSEKNIGYIASFEALVKDADEDIFVFCDQDDVWEQDRLTKAVDYMLETGAVLVTCDRSIINAKDEIVEASYRDSHPKVYEVNWNTGDDITVRAASSCHSIGMATMVRADIAKQALPFPAHTAHDLWVTLIASELGKVAFLTDCLVQYRRHGENVSGTLTGVETKQDWIDTRVAPHLMMAREFCTRFPNSIHANEIASFAHARETGNVLLLFKYRKASPAIAWFEIALHIVPTPIFSLITNFIKKRSH
ncbi:MAG: glycosyltransferase [Coriobacteriaceae bacterium]|nr:glycosyltransferase [Coriobacteriaceae bacterium]